MGYELYITRASSWLETKRSPISKEEWEKIVAEDQELQLSTDDYYERMQDAKRERFHPIIWTTHPDRVPLWFIDGAIEVKNADQSTVRKMVQLARKLNARVIGEAEEEYGEDGERL